MSHFHDFSAMPRGKKIFPVLDLNMAYHQTFTAVDEIPKTAVITPFGLFKYHVMTFGLKNVGQTFQRHIFRSLGDHNCLGEFRVFVLSRVLCRSGGHSIHSVGSGSFPRSQVHMTRRHFVFFNEDC